MRSLLGLKTLRDLRSTWVQQASVSVMVVLGVAFMTGSYSVYRNLDESYKASYRRLSFEDFSIRVKSAPERLAERIASVRGIEAVEARLVEEASLELPSKPGAKMAARLIGIPPARPLEVNQLQIVTGRPPEARAHEVLVEANFGAYHQLRPGDLLEVSRGRTKLTLRVCGIARSVEYLYVVRSKQDLISMPDTFGVLFIDQEKLQQFFGKGGQINSIHVVASRPALRESSMVQALSAAAPYHPDEPVPREDQPSYQMLQQDVQGFQAYAILFPALFLSVAVMTVSTMLTRIVFAQRPTIGLFRCLGLSKGAVLRHYLLGATLVGFAASLAGALCGVYLGRVLSLYYMYQLQVPHPSIEPRWGVTALGVVVGTLACMGAAMLPAWRGAGLAPAEAMRPPVPSFGRRSLRVDWLLPRLSLIQRIPLRNVFRQPRRTLATLAGVVSALCLLVTARGMLDSMNVMLGGMMEGMFGYDLRIDFMEYQSRRAVATARTWPGVNWCEGVLELPMDFEHRGRKYSALLNGVEPDSRLRTLKDEIGRPVPLSDSGAIFGPTLRSRLDLRIGDIVQVTLPRALTSDPPRTRQIRVAGFNWEAVGTQAYLPRQDVERLFRRDLGIPGNAVTGLLMQTAPNALADVRRRALDLPYAVAATNRQAVRAMVDRLVATTERFVLIMQAFGFVLAFATLFNMVAVNVMERVPEIATLRTLGLSSGQIGWMVSLETAAVTAIGIVVGLPVARAFVQLFLESAQTPEQQDLFMIKVAVEPYTYLSAALSVVVISALALVPALRVAGTIDLVKSIKERAL